MDSENDFEMRPVVSSQIAQVGYNAETRQLRVEFNHKGSTYDYDDVPQEVFEGLVNAPSVGAHFTAAIKNVYPYTKVA